jgi:hypothetical protein
LLNLKWNHNIVCTWATQCSNHKGRECYVLHTESRVLCHVFFFFVLNNNSIGYSKYLFQSAAMFPRMYIVVVYQMAVDRVIKHTSHTNVQATQYPLVLSNLTQYTSSTMVTEVSSLLCSILILLLFEISPEHWYSG